MDKFLGTYNCQKLDQEKISSINRSITCSENEAVIKNLPKKGSPDIQEIQSNIFYRYRVQPEIAACKQVLVKK
jgi:hypothetical protein